MNIIFRVDASSKIGTGHVMRCLTLAKVLKKQGAKCSFICRDQKNNLINKIKAEKFKVTVLKFPKKVLKSKISKNNSKKYSNWLSVDFDDDAFQTINALNNKEVDWLIVDHYGIEKKWEKKLRPKVKNLMVIDDLANRNHDCDLLVDQNLVRNFKIRYKNILPKFCKTFLGPEYALLQNEYRDFYSTAPTKIGPVNNILVYFGGTDLYNLTESVLDAFLKLNRKDIFLNVVVNSNNPNIQKFLELSKHHKNIKIICDLISLAPLMLRADISIGACGATTWERCCLGLPSLVITVAENQKQIAKELNKQGIIRWLGHYNKISKKSIYQALEIYSNQNLKNWSEACKLVTDGYGALKVAANITLNPKSVLKARSAKNNDETLLLRWANDPLVRKNSFNPNIIPSEAHHIWFNKRIKNPDYYKILIVETKEALPIGQVRIEKKKNKGIIDYSLAEFARGKKIANIMLNTALKKFKNMGITNFFAEVKKNNKASSKVFKKAGFKIKTTPDKNFITFFFKNKL